MRRASADRMRARGARARRMRDARGAIPPLAGGDAGGEQQGGHREACRGCSRRRGGREATSARVREAGSAAEPPPPPVKPDDAPSLKTYDPWARLNRFTYRFNARFDEAIFLPVANGYRRFVPSPLRGGVHSFFANLTEVDSVINYTLQGRLHRTVRSFGRFVINTTLGIGGLFDVAAKLATSVRADRIRHHAREMGHAPRSLSGHSAVGSLDVPRRRRLCRRLRHRVRDQSRRSVPRRSILGIRESRTPSISARTSIFAITRRARRSSTRPFAFSIVRKQLIEDAGLHKSKPLPKPNPDEPAGK
jgi:hypothetical protein